MPTGAKFTAPKINASAFGSSLKRQTAETRSKLFLYTTVRSHYDSVDRIANDVEKLGYKAAAQILRERLPRTKKARSGDLGEILACELVEEERHFTVPVRRLRYKDGREMALRGDDFKRPDGFSNETTSVISVRPKK
jgi:Cap4 SAVED domain